MLTTILFKGELKSISVVVVLPVVPQWWCFCS